MESVGKIGSSGEDKDLSAYWPISLDALVEFLTLCFLSDSKSCKHISANLSYLREKQGRSFII